MKYVLASILSAFILSTVALADKASASFQAGRIMDDAVMSDYNSMDTASIQRFLSSKVTCDTWGEEPSEYGGGTRAQYAASRGWQSPPYYCMTTYVEGGKSAAQLVYEKAQKYRISPKVLLVLLQKEQGLITDEWPLYDPQYKTATGYGCPDTAPCDSQYFGLANQLDWAAKMFRSILDNSSSWYTPYVLGDNYIQYSPTASCGGSTVNIQNRATQALYNYTPYQPNQAALDAGWGTAPCGAYGNRNFYLYFTSWFGSTTNLNVTPLSMHSPRWMELSSSVQKVDYRTGQPVDDALTTGLQVYFEKRVTVNGELCLVTRHDASNNITRCIPFSSLREIEPVYTDLTSAEIIQAMRSSGYKQDLITSVPNKNFPLAKTKQISFAKKTRIGNQDLYVTNYDFSNGIRSGIPATSLVQNSSSFTPIQPKVMRLTSDTQKLAFGATTGIDGTLPSGINVEFSSEVTINGVRYLRSSHDTRTGHDKVIRADLLTEFFTPFAEPRWMQLNEDTQKINPLTGAVSGGVLKKGTRINMETKTSVRGEVFFRTKHDTQAEAILAIPMQRFSELSLDNFVNPRWKVANQDTSTVNPATGAVTGAFSNGSLAYFDKKITLSGVTYFHSSNANITVDSTALGEVEYSTFLHPREMRLTTDSRKIRPHDGLAVDELHKAGLVTRYDSKLTVNGVTYYRTAHDTSNNFNRAFPSSLLENL